MELAGRLAVVTGASRGIGRSLALALAGQGCHLFLTTLESDELDAVAALVVAEHDVAVTTHAADLTTAAGRQGLADRLVSLAGTIDILVNNAGAGWFGSFAGSSWQSVERTLQLDVHAPTQLMHALMPGLQRRPEAMVVNISSAVGRLPYPGLATYGAAKGYLSSLSASLQCELSPGNVHLLCFHPGFTATSFIDSAGMDLRRVPRFMIARPEKVAARIVQAMKRNETWVYGDAAGRMGAILGTVLPHGLLVRMSRGFYWELPES